MAYQNLSKNYGYSIHQGACKASGVKSATRGTVRRPAYAATHRDAPDLV